MFAADSRGAEVLAGPLVNPANAHHYYLLSEDTWQASERFAQELGGHLATVNDLAEQLGIEVCWKATPGRTYDLQRCLDLTHPVWDAVGIVASENGEGCLSIQGGSDFDGFYRLHTHLE